MRKLLPILAIASLVSAPAAARDVTVEITNLTNATYFTPLVVAAHTPNASLFTLGEPASAELQALAEGGDISGILDQLDSLLAIYRKASVVVADPAGGVLAPGESTRARMRVSGQNDLTILGMMLPTNDGFVGLRSVSIPFDAGTYMYTADGYDAGTEANDEVVVGDIGGLPGVPGIPVDPSGEGGTGGTGVVATEHNETVHIHRGVIGDMDPTGGISDVNAAMHRWLNPVARVVIKVDTTADAR